MNHATASRTLAVLLQFAAAGAAIAQTPATPASPAAQPPAAATPAPATAPAASAPAPAAASTPAPPPAPASARSGDNMEGLAAVYSTKLSGRRTASGQAFSQAKLTAAHPSLPFGSKVKVTNTKNNKSVEVTVNDRGPAHAGRVIDLSSAAAAKIGIGKKGMAPVKLEVVGAAAKK
ncbi:MAG: septal ring lytic transglycosylase RlpA family protein [Betaproteobacteria bacterium]